MKPLFFTFLLLFSQTTFSQKVEKFYDYQWREVNNSNDASYYSVVEPRDSAWVRNDFYLNTQNPQMVGSYKDAACTLKNGLFFYYHSNKRILSFGNYKDGHKDGQWLSYHSNGMLRDSGMYSMDKLVGTYMQWYPNGYLEDSMTSLGNGKYSSISWFDNGNLSSAGILKDGKCQGKWKYYHRNGNQAAMEIFSNGKRLEKQYFSESGEVQSDTTSKDRQASYSKGFDNLYKILSGSVSFPNNLRFDSQGKASIVVRYTINESGEMKDPEIVLPLHPEFDAMVLAALPKVAKWNPAISHNRKIATVVLQPFTFNQP